MLLKWQSKACLKVNIETFAEYLIQIFDDSFQYSSVPSNEFSKEIKGQFRAMQ